jgi:hypothetical protein
VTFASLTAPRRCTASHGERGMARRPIAAALLHVRCTRCRRHASELSLRPCGPLFLRPCGLYLLRPCGLYLLRPCGRHCRVIAASLRTPFIVAGQAGCVPRSPFPLAFAPAFARGPLARWAVGKARAAPSPPRARRRVASTPPWKLGPAARPRDASDRRDHTSLGPQRTAASANRHAPKAASAGGRCGASTGGQYMRPTRGRGSGGWWRRAHGPAPRGGASASAAGGVVTARRRFLLERRPPCGKNVLLPRHAPRPALAIARRFGKQEVKG